jgi:molecular chaperone Hsp33
MKKPDILQRFLFENAPIRGEFVHLEQTFQTIIQQHNYPPLIQRLLGEALVLVSLLTAAIKFEGRLSIQFQGSGKLKLLLVQSSQNFHLRGLAQFSDDLEEKDLQNDLRKGVLVITMDPEDSVQRYQGIVAWQGKSLSESIEAYFRDSEQLLTRIWIAVDETRASGMLLQAMPEQDVSGHRSPMRPDHPDWEHMTALTQTIKPNELFTLDNQTILHRLYVQEDMRLYDADPVMFGCTCSAKRGENAILMLGRAEAEEELVNSQNITVTCDFCSKEFVFDRVDVENIFRKGDSLPPSTQIH